MPIASIGTIVKVTPGDEVQIVRGEDDHVFVDDRSPFWVRVAFTLRENGALIGVTGPVIDGHLRYQGLFATLLVRIDDSNWETDTHSGANFKVGRSPARRIEGFPYQHPDGTAMGGYPYLMRYGSIDVENSFFPSSTSILSSYPATYFDSRGSETTTILNDGETLGMRLRGVEFAGGSFDMLDSVNANPEQLRPFTLHQDALCSCRIECRIPVPIQDHGNLRTGSLLVELILGNPVANGTIDRDDLKIVLEYGGLRFSSPGTTGYFSDELDAIQSQLPEGVFMKTCLNCLYSDYHPAGRGLFGTLMCFRNLKEKYLKVRTKSDFGRIQSRFDRQVQETYLCPEFERRRADTGYSG